LACPAGHVFAGAAANDPVPDLPPADPAGWFEGSSHFGTNPAFPQFVARDFYWQKQGCTINTSGGFSSNQPAIYGETRDAFLISLDSDSKNALFMGATSPCIYPDGTPPS
jgi:hypothetical protein